MTFSMLQQTKVKQILSFFNHSWSMCYVCCRCLHFVSHQQGGESCAVITEKRVVSVSSRYVLTNISERNPKINERGKSIYRAETNAASRQQFKPYSSQNSAPFTS